MVFVAEGADETTGEERERVSHRFRLRRAAVYSKTPKLEAVTHRSGVVNSADVVVREGHMKNLGVRSIIKRTAVVGWQ